MSTTQANAQGLPTAETSPVGPPESKDIIQPAEIKDSHSDEDTKEESASEDEHASDVNEMRQNDDDNSPEAKSLMQLQSLVLKLQLDQNRLLEQVETLQQRGRSRTRKPGPRSRSVSRRSRSREPSVEPEKPTIQCRLNPQFWRKFERYDPDSTIVCPVDILVGDPEHASSGKDPRKRIQPGAGNNDDKEALNELERIKGKYMPEQISVNIFSLQYLLRLVFGKKAKQPVEFNKSGLLYLRPYKNILKNRDALKEKINAIIELLERHEEEEKLKVPEQEKKKGSDEKQDDKEESNTENEEQSKKQDEKEDKKGEEKNETDNQKKEEIQSQKQDETKGQNKETKEKKENIKSKSPIDSKTITEKVDGSKDHDHDADNSEKDEQKSQKSDIKPDSVSISVEFITDMLEKLDMVCCTDCNKKLQEDFPTVSDAKSLLKCFWSLVEDYMVPVHTDYRKRTRPQTNFSDLWHVFQPGDHLVMNKDPDLDYDSSNWYTSVWRVLRVQGGRQELCKVARPPRSLSPPSQRARTPPPPPREIDGIIPFTIDAYGLDFDGSVFVPVRRRFLIMPFPGERKMTDLPVFPLEYASDRKALEDKMITRGRRFAEYVGSKKTGYHLDCRGPNLLDTSERLDEPVIVDIEGYWRGTTNTGQPVYSAPEPLDARETSHFCLPNRRCDSSNQMSYVLDHYIDQELMDEDIRERSIFDDYNERSLKEKIELSENDYLICTHRLYGWLLRSRKWAAVHIDSLSKVHTSRSDLSFNQLVLPPETKRMIQSQVQEHFRKRRSQIKDGASGLDLVGGKGLGLTILIHGAPGVGKTATAECVADLVEKPLYPLTCGDMGSRANEIEKNLSYHLSAATRWDCILLLDEADVFMAKRTKEDYGRNATVSVFLRMLEYYRGVLILTTNRIGTFDEAFKSRIHLSLFYPNFNEEDTVAVFKVFLQRTINTYSDRGDSFEVDTKGIKAFARDHYNRVSEDARWNGRQIRNAFHTALAMAEYDARTKIAGLDPTDPKAYSQDCKAPVKLGRAQFEAIANTVSLFDDYLEETMGVSHAARLENEKVRKKTRVRERKTEKDDKEKELRRQLEALKKSKAKDQISDSDDSSSEEEKPKSKKKKSKTKDSDSDSDDSDSSKEKAKKNKKKDKKKRKEQVVSSSDSE